MENEFEYKTKDFYLSVCLMAYGIRPQLQKTGYKTFLFIFSNQDGQIEKLVESHWSGNLKISSKSFVDAITELKARIYDEN